MGMGHAYRLIQFHSLNFDRTTPYLCIYLADIQLSGLHEMSQESLKQERHESLLDAARNRKRKGETRQFEWEPEEREHFCRVAVLGETAGGGGWSTIDKKSSILLVVLKHQECSLCR